MRRFLAHLTAALAAAIGSLGLLAGAAVAAGSVTTAGPSTAATAAATGSATAAGSGSATPAVTSTTSTATPTTTTPTTTTPTTPAPAPKPAVKAKAKLYLDGTFTVRQVGGDGAPAHRRGGRAIVRPYVAGQTVEVRSYVGHRLFKTDHLRVKPIGEPQLRTVHRDAPEPGSGTRPRRGDPRSQRGDARLLRRAGVLGADPERRLRRPRSVRRSAPAAAGGAARLRARRPGVYDTQTGSGARRLPPPARLGRGRPECRTPTRSAALLNGQGTFHVRYPSNGNHAEGDLSDQVLALINGSQGLPAVPDQLGQAVDADDPRQLPGLLPGAGLPARRDVLLELLLQRVRHPRL